jgi:hypothetical protein
MAQQGLLSRYFACRPLSWLQRLPVAVIHTTIFGFLNRKGQLELKRSCHFFQRFAFNVVETELTIGVRYPSNMTNLQRAVVSTMATSDWDLAGLCIERLKELTFTAGFSKQYHAANYETRSVLHRTLWALTAQLRNLERLELPYEEYLEPDLDVGKFPKLKVLHLHISFSGRLFERNFGTVELHVTFRGTWQQDFAVDAPGLAWLRSLTIHDYDHTALGLDFLSCLPNLQVCHVFVELPTWTKPLPESIQSLGCLTTRGFLFQRLPKSLKHLEAPSVHGFFLASLERTCPRLESLKTSLPARVCYGGIYSNLQYLHTLELRDFSQHLRPNSFPRSLHTLTLHLTLDLSSWECLSAATENKLARLILYNSKVLNREATRSFMTHCGPSLKHVELDDLILGPVAGWECATSQKWSPCQSEQPRFRLVTVAKQFQIFCRNE